MLYQRELDFLVRIFEKCSMPIKTISACDLEGNASNDIFPALAGKIEDRTLYKMTDSFGELVNRK